MPNTRSITFTRLADGITFGQDAVERHRLGLRLAEQRAGLVGGLRLSGQKLSPVGSLVPIERDRSLLTTKGNTASGQYGRFRLLERPLARSGLRAAHF